MYDKNIQQFSGNAIGLILPNDILDVEKQEFETILQNLTKGQIISEYPYEIIVSPKIPTKIFSRFLP